MGRLSLPRPASRADLVKLIGSLSKPFTLVRTQLNGLIEYPWWSWSRPHRLATDAVDAVDDAAVDMSLYKTQPCWFYEKGCCAKGDNCTYKHGDDDEGVPGFCQEPSKDFLCWYHARGICARGVHCTFKGFTRRVV